MQPDESLVVEVDEQPAGGATEQGVGIGDDRDHHLGMKRFPGRLRSDANKATIDAENASILAIPAVPRVPAPRARAVAASTR